MVLLVESVVVLSMHIFALALLYATYITARRYAKGKIWVVATITYATLAFALTRTTTLLMEQKVVDISLQWFWALQLNATVVAGILILEALSHISKKRERVETQTFKSEKNQ